MSHDHGVKNYNKAFALGIALNIIFVVVEASYGVMADSLALIADAWHNLSDVVSLLLAWGASYLSMKPATLTRTYGLKRASILASLISAVLLIFALGGIAYEAIERFSNPQSIHGLTVIVVAGIGVLINAATAMLFMADQKHDLNIRGAYLHMLTDAGVSFGVVLAGLVFMFTGWLWLDPLISLLIVLVVLVGTWGLLKDSINLSLDAVPKEINIMDIRNYLEALQDISEIHDLHVWALGTRENALSVHLISKDTHINNDFLYEVQKHLHDNFHIEHATIQVESTQNNKCLLNQDKCV